MAENYLTVEQVAARLQLHPFTIRRQLQSGRLRGVKRGRVWRVPESALGESSPHSGALPDLDELLARTGERMERAGITSDADIQRVIDETRAKLGTLASREALREMGRAKRRQMAEDDKGTR